MSSPAPSLEKPAAPRPEMDDAPPLLGSWRNIYLVVLGTFVLFVALFWALTEAYS
ncbi:hypothetical protein HPC49_27365 [Pyxidicoccus fallax]|uniref:Uncharacterized protein n=1 Tax=Pyxidicoccus fallax TaxID=394095 RepID=A0A848LT97_9BACT|nr:hypothetical protein [Pyxidicoccus fallax]NMO20899.1 hypothetical protein [Pyxidicoccus fallax]NPC81925.1 hypothetical protein [Pyxidicoccus fallax]